MKTCATCCETKPRTDFPSSGWQARLDGSKRQVVKPDCKVCHNAKTTAHIEALMTEIGVVWKCTRCGYDKYKGVIDFHHRDPTQKDFVIASRSSISKKKLMNEVAKCVILCKICHGELHAGLWSLGD